MTAPEDERRDAAARRARDELSHAVDKDAARLEKAREDNRSVLGYTVFSGTIAVLFVLPVIGGAYLGRWIDAMAAGYSVRWTVSLILLGVVVGAVNVYRYLEQHQ